MTRWLPRWNRRPASDVLERRYRRLLAWYPADYREANTEEMLGVALAAARPGQRRPGAAESASLIVSGVRTRFSGVLAGLREPSWQDAAAVLAIIGPILIVAFSGELVVGTGYVTGGGLMLGMSRTSVLGIIMMIGWTLVAVAAIARWRRIAAAGACAGVIGLASLQGLYYSGNLIAFVTGWWEIVIGVVVAASALVAMGSDHRPLSWRAITTIAVSAALLVLWPLESTTATAVPALVVIMLLLEIKRLNPAIRQRVIVLLLPVFVTVVPVSWLFTSVTASRPRFGIQLAAPEWAALAVAPVLSFAVGLIWIARHERVLRRTSVRRQQRN
jgi:hypothetical protein